MKTNQLKIGVVAIIREYDSTEYYSYCLYTRNVEIVGAK